MKFSDEDNDDIKQRSASIRTAYSALGGKYCLKRGEENEMIAYFTALRCTKEDLPLLIDVTNNIAVEVLQRRFNISR